MQTQATQSPITPARAPHRRELTATAVRALLRLDTDTGQLFWLANRRGRVQAGTRAGCEIRRNGKSAGRVLTIEGVRYREHHVAHLLRHGTWPMSKRTAKRTQAIAASVEMPIAAAVAPAPIKPAPRPIVPRDLPEISRAAIAAAKPAHRGFLAGLARHFTR